MAKDGVSITIRNFDRFDRILNGLGSISKGTKIVKTSLMQAAKPVRTAAKKEAPVRKKEPFFKDKIDSRNHKKGTLRRSIKSALRPKYGDKNFFAAAVFTQRGGAVNSDGWFSHMVNSGHKIVLPSGAKKGKTPPNEFMARGRKRSRLAFNSVMKMKLRNNLAKETQSKINKLK